MMPLLLPAPRVKLFDILEELESERPKIRADCKGGPRPCPWIMCRWHAIWSLNDSSKPILMPGEKPKHPLMKKTDEEILARMDRLRQTCIMDVIDMGGVTLEEIGDNVLLVTRERVRQIEGHWKNVKMKDGTIVTQFVGAINRIKHSKARRRKLEQFNEDDIFHEQAYPTWIPDKRRGY